MKKQKYKEMRKKTVFIKRMNAEIWEDPRKNCFHKVDKIFPSVVERKHFGIGRKCVHYFQNPVIIIVLLILRKITKTNKSVENYFENRYILLMLIIGDRGGIYI